MSATYGWRRRTKSLGCDAASLKKESRGALTRKPALYNEAEKPELIEGYAHICFDDQGSWFRGSLVNANGTAYNLNGKRTHLGVHEEMPLDASLGTSFDIIRDFPTAMKSAGSVESQTSLGVNGTSSRQSSLDCNTARELQFILEDLPTDDGSNNNSHQSLASPADSASSLPVSRPGSPPTTQQLLKALDSLFINSADCCSSLEPRGESSDPSSPHRMASPFRSRSGSRSLPDPVSAVFDLTVYDLEDGTRHLLRNVNSRNGPKCTMRSRQLCFITDRVFWGQRADLVIQKQLAAPDLVGKNCHVYAGPMRLYFNQLAVPAHHESYSNQWCW